MHTFCTPLSKENSSILTTFFPQNPYHRAHLDTERLPSSAHHLMVDILGGEMLYVLTGIESHSGYSSRKKKVKVNGRERDLKGSKIDLEEDLAVEEFLRVVTSSGKTQGNADQKKLKEKRCDTFGGILL